MKKFKVCLVLVIGLLCCFTGIYMKSVKKTWVENRNQTRTVETKSKTATGIGIGIGAGIGTGAGVAIGGIGVACCGAGFGIPVGVVCLTLAGLLGTAGGMIGHSVGKGTETVSYIEKIVHTDAVFQPWMCNTVLIVGICVFICAIFMLTHAKNISAVTE